MTRLRPVIEELIDAQRALTRALIAKDGDARKDALQRREAAAAAIEAALRSIEIAYDLTNNERIRLAARSDNFAAVVGEIRRSNPESLDAAIARVQVGIDEDERLSAVFLERLNTAVGLGLATQIGGKVHITYAGVAELLRADERHKALDELRIEHAQAERRISVLEKLIEKSAAPSPEPVTGAMRAVGG